MSLSTGNIDVAGVGGTLEPSHSSEPCLDLSGVGAVEPVGEDVKETGEGVCVQQQAGHSFYWHTFSSSAYCSFCEEFIWGLRKQALKCSGAHLSPSFSSLPDAPVG